MQSDEPGTFGVESDISSSISSSNMPSGIASGESSAGGIVVGVVGANDEDVAVDEVGFGSRSSLVLVSTDVESWSQEVLPKAAEESSMTQLEVPLAVLSGDTPMSASFLFESLSLASISW